MRESSIRIEPPTRCDRRRKGKTLLDRESGLTNPRSYFFRIFEEETFWRGNYTFRSNCSQGTVTVRLLEEDATWPRLTPPQVTLKWYKRCRFLSLCKIPMPPLASVPQSDQSRISFAHSPTSTLVELTKVGC